MLAALKKHWGPKICSWVPRDLWHRLLNVELLLPYYHMVSDREVPHVDGLYKFRSVQQFDADMDFFLRSYTPVNLQDIISHLEGIRRLPRRCFLPTFDDGFREIYEIVAPILLTRGIPAVFFLTTSVIDNRELCSSAKKSLLIHTLNSSENPVAKQKVSQLLNEAMVDGPDLSSRIRRIPYRQRRLLDELGPLLGCDFLTYSNSVKPYMNSTQIANLIGKGFTIGAHSINHPLYAELSLAEQLEQTQASLGWLSDRFTCECQAFAFPYRDAGVAPEFFNKAFADGRLKVSFGTAGLCDHFYPRNLERFTMENTNRGAAEILAREFGVNAFRRILKTGRTKGGLAFQNRPAGRSREMRNSYP